MADFRRRAHRFAPLANAGRALRAIAFIALLAPLFSVAQPKAARSDEYLSGYLSAILEQELNWAPDSYDIAVERGVATIKLRNLDRDRGEKQRQAETRLKDIAGLRAINFVTEDAKTAHPSAWRGIGESAGRMLGVSGATTSFPAGDVFWPLIADEKQPQFFVSLRHYDTPADTTTVAAVAYGETFGLLRILAAGDNNRDGLQFSVTGALFAQFDLGAPSNDLVNADYTVGVQTTYRRGVNSARLRLYHQSSHLGDEFLLRVRPERVNLTYESLELLLARQWSDDRWRAYAGGEYLLGRDPSELKPGVGHFGVEYYGERPVIANGRLIGGVDLKSYQENDWAVDTSLKVGLEFGRFDAGGRRVRVLAEGYRGFAPHGQFYSDRINYFGVGLYLGF